MPRKWLTLVVGLLVAGLMLHSANAGDVFQVAISATPVRLSLASPTPFTTLPLEFTPTPTRTTTPIGIALLEAKADAGPVNVRAAPDPNSEKLGTIRYGEKYPVLGRFFQWYQFQYDPSPNQRGWVFGELVDIIGDPATIVDLNTNVLPTLDTSIINITQTWEAIVQAPGGILTATAEARIIPVPGSREINPEITAEAASASISSNALPTFTYPPDVLAQAPTQGALGGAATSNSSNGLSTAVENGIAPIVPIAVLTGLGLLGLLLSSKRQL